MDAHSIFEILVNEHADMLWVYLRAAVRDASAVDDLFQETMLTAWRKLDEFDRTRPFGPWLRGIAARHVLAYRRHAAHEPFACDDLVLAHLDRRLETVSRRPGDTWLDKLADLRACIEALPDRYAEVVRLRYREGLNPSELANRLALPHETLKKRLARAKARLLECLTRRFRWEIA